jgi:Ca-activated chloride channel family protein
VKFKSPSLWLSAIAVATFALSPMVADPASAAGLLVADGGQGGVLKMKQHDVRVTINNSIAVTQIDQVFLNTEDRQVEALYTFPVPREASVSNFSMWINGKEMIGEVVEKERAREIYNSYKRVKRDPGLLEQVDYKQFEMRIFPIAAGAEQRVRIEYYQELDIDHDWATYVYPLATDTSGRAMDTQVDGRFSMSVDVRSEVPIEKLKSESHEDDFVVVSHADNYAQAAMELTEGELSRDIVMTVKAKRARTGLDVVTSRPKGEDGYFMMTLTPGDDLSDTSEAMDYVFLLDISGSMTRDGKLAISRDSVSAFIESLGENDRFDCLAFNIAPTALFQQLATVDEQNIERAREFFQNQRAKGGTILQPALAAAYKYRDSDRPLNVVLLSDGMTEAGEQAELLRMINSRPDGVRVFCVGVGNEVNRPLLEQMASGAGGLAAFVSTEDSFARQAQLMRQKLIRPAIKDLSMEFSGVSVTEVEPVEMGDLFYGTPLRVYGRYATGGTLEITLRGTIQGAPWEQTVQVVMPEGDEGNSEIERMWAQKRVQRLLGRERAGLSREKDEIVRLCEGYSIVSPYASMLVLENDAEFQRWKIEQRNATRIERDRQSRESVQTKLADLRRRSSEGFEVDHANRLVNNQQKPSSGSQPAPAAPAQPGADSGQTPRSVDLDLGSSSAVRTDPGSSMGGGPIEPITAVLTIAGAGAAFVGRRRQRAAAAKR